jgi:hypothetical protein
MPCQPHHDQHRRHKRTDNPPIERAGLEERLFGFGEVVPKFVRGSS